jgi:hypothetical protein
MYSIELYDGAVIGNTAVVAMGGATQALAIGTAGTLFNPSAPAIRLSTDNGSWNWDYHLDYLSGSLSTDYDNNGFRSDNGGTSVYTLGFGLRIGNWGGVITYTGFDAPVAANYMLPDGSTAELAASTGRTQFALARWIGEIDTALGASYTSANFDFSPQCAGDGCGTLFSVTGRGFELGATWLPKGQSFRIGATAATQIAGGDISGCDPSDCSGWILPEAVVSPARAALGGAYRWAETAWNQQVDKYFRDERALIVAADVIVIGPSKNAFGLEAFGNHLLQRSGRDTNVSVRAGAEYEALPGRLRLRAGSYWEPGRFVDVPGRIHVTFGLELSVLHFWFFKPRRGRISLTSDVAAHYRNIGLSIGFWH